MVSFGALKVTLMRASWIPIHNGDEAPNMIRDQYGLFLVSHDMRLFAMETPFDFPSQVSQVMHCVGMFQNCTYVRVGVLDFAWCIPISWRCVVSVKSSTHM
jgi:hypothetical protein